MAEASTAGLTVFVLCGVTAGGGFCLHRRSYGLSVLWPGSWLLQLAGRRQLLVISFSQP